MTLEVVHPFISNKADGADPTQVQPSNWNANHQLSQLPGTILGAVAGGAGQTVELPLSIDPTGYAIFETTTAVRLAVGTTGQRPISPSPGDERYNTTTNSKEYWNGVQWAVVTAAVPTGVTTWFEGKPASCPAGWVVSDGRTIGDAVSNATFADPSAQALFTLLYNDGADGTVPLKTSGGVIIPRSTYASAALAFAAHTQMTTPNLKDVFVTGAGGTNAPLPFVTGGAANVTLVAANLPPHQHELPNAAHSFNNAQGGGGLPINDSPGVNTGDGHTLGLSSTPFSVLNPFIGLTPIVKL